MHSLIYYKNGANSELEEACSHRRELEDINRGNIDFKQSNHKAQLGDRLT